MKRISSQSADLLGISASVLCLIHCLAFPVFISMGYIFQHTDHQDHDHMHWHWMDYFFIALAIWAVYSAAKNTQSQWIKIALWLAVGVFSISVALHELRDWVIYVSVAASIALTIIHMLNWKYHRKCDLRTK